MPDVWLPFLFMFAFGPQDAPLPGADRIGVRVADFTLGDYRGRQHRFSDLSDRRLVVVVFLGADCPLAKLYGPRLAELAKEYENRGVAFLGIDANQQESLGDLARYAREHHIAFPLLKDVGNVVADRFGARRTPEAFVLDQERVIRYRGGIDGQYGVGVRKPAESRRDLVEALEELLAGKPVSRPVTAAVGCLISRTAPPGQGTVTYAKDVAPLLERRCQHCHRPGQIGPFALTSYREASGWAAMIREVVEQGRMPPWSANPDHGKFANDPSLSAAEKKLLFDWIDADCPEGDPADRTPPRRFADDWNIPTPDLVLSMPRPFTVPATGVVEYQFVEVDPGFTEDRWVQAAEIRPGNRAVVHHCNVFLWPPGEKNVPDDGKLGSGCLVAMAAGTLPLVLPPGMAMRVPAGWRLLFVLHYSPIGSEQTDQTSLGLKFADPKTVRQQVTTQLMYDPGLRLVPREANQVVSQTWHINEDVLLLAMFPHMHLRGKSFRYEALHANGETEVLLDVPKFDFNWQHRYILAEPRRLPAGTRLRCTAVYDNSESNPANPDPTATVRAGPQSWDEMFNGYFDVVRADEDLTQPPPWPARIRAAVGPFGLPIAWAGVLGCGAIYLRRRKKAASEMASRVA
jgi:peroxiredoxin